MNDTSQAAIEALNALYADPTLTEEQRLAGVEEVTRIAKEYTDRLTAAASNR